MKTQNNETKNAHIAGRYSIVVALIALFGTIFGSLTTLYLTKQQESNSPQEEKLESLQSSYSDLQSQYNVLEEEAHSLQTAYDEALAKLESLSQSVSQPSSASSESKFQSSIQSPASSQSSAIPEQTNPTITKLTSIPILRKDALSFLVYNNEDKDLKAKSNVGDTFETCITLRAHEEESIDFYLNRKYNTLTFTFCLAQESRYDDDKFGSISICSISQQNGNEQVLAEIYASPTITSGFIPESVGPLDVSGVECLRICIYNRSNGSYSSPFIILGDPELT